MKRSSNSGNLHRYVIQQTNYFQRLFQVQIYENIPSNPTEMLIIHPKQIAKKDVHKFVNINEVSQPHASLLDHFQCNYRLVFVEVHAKINPSVLFNVNTREVLLKPNPQSICNIIKKNTKNINNKVKFLWLFLFLFFSIKLVRIVECGKFQAQLYQICHDIYIYFELNFFLRLFLGFGAVFQNSTSAKCKRNI